MLSVLFCFSKLRQGHSSRRLLRRHPLGTGIRTQASVGKQMETGKFTHNSLHVETLTTPTKTYRKVLKSSSLAFTMLLVHVQGWILQNMAYLVHNGRGRFARYCGKMYSRHLFSYGGFFTRGLYGPYFLQLFWLSLAIKYGPYRPLVKNPP